MLDTNLKSVFLCCKHAIPKLRAAGGGAIVNVSSVLGLVGGDEDFATHAYAASKAGIIGLSRAIAVHYARERHPLQRRRARPDRDADERARAGRRAHPRARCRELQPLTGDFGTPEDVAGRGPLPRDAPTS